MASDIVPELCIQIENIPKDKKEIDILIVSDGGDPIVSWRIISLLRERFDKIGVLIPYQAYSAATLVALGADEIIMHPFSNLGPVDPQLHDIKNVPGTSEKEKTHFASEDLAHFIDVVSKDVGISEQEKKERSFELVCNEIGANRVGIAKQSSNLAHSLGVKLLSLHMSDQNKVKAISDALNKSFYHHGCPVGRTEAKKIGLPVIEAPDDIENLIWSVWKDVEDEMSCKEPFNPFEVLMNDPSSSEHLAPVQQLEIPVNLPPQLLNQIYQQHFQQVKVVSLLPVKYEMFQATLESTHIRSEYRSVLLISGVRMPDLNININVAPMSQGWRTIVNE
jgi:hypothetical protein